MDDDVSDHLDLADGFPDFLSLDTLSLVPSIGRGWHFILQSALSQMRVIIEQENLSGLVFITDVKEKRGWLEISWGGCSTFLDKIEQELEERAQITCAFCGVVHCGEHKKDWGGPYS